MGLLSKSVTGISAIVGLAIFSQAPEFAQQYRQRLGGAVAELQTVVEDFDRDAQASSMSRAQALESMQSAAQPFSRDRGKSMARTVDRYEGLSAQRQSMEAADPIVRPIEVLRYPDAQVLDGAWEIFEPALPLNLPGLVYGGAGALVLTLLARTGIGTARRARKKRNDRLLGVEG